MRFEAGLADCERLGQFEEEAVYEAGERDVFPKLPIEFTRIRTRVQDFGSRRIRICILFIPSIDLYSFINRKDLPFLFQALHSFFDVDIRNGLPEPSSGQLCISDLCALQWVYRPPSIQTVPPSCFVNYPNLMIFVLKSECR
jgi:hypothetical protein